MLLIRKAKKLCNLAFSSVELSGAFAFSCWKLALVGVGLEVYLFECCYCLPFEEGHVALVGQTWRSFSKFSKLKLCSA